jgi:hypothetical protein
MKFDAETPPRRVLQPLQLGAPDIEAWLRAKSPRAIGSYLDLAPEEYARAFTAAQTAGTDIADDLYRAMIDNVAQGGTEKSFKDLVVPTLKAKGWLGGDEGQIAYRVALIYDTNLRIARAAGRRENYVQARALFPYLRAFTVGDERVRHPPKSAHSDHRAWDGIILPVEHPFWSIYWTPLGFRCRCDIVQMSRSELARYRGGITPDDELEWRKQRIGPPVFLAPGAPIGSQLAEVTERTNARRKMPGLPPVDPVRTERAGRDIWDTVLAAKSREDLGRQLARFGFG